MIEITNIQFPNVYDKENITLMKERDSLEQLLRIAIENYLADAFNITATITIK